MDKKHLVSYLGTNYIIDFPIEKVPAGMMDSYAEIREPIDESDLQLYEVTAGNEIVLNTEKHLKKFETYKASILNEMKETLLLSLIEKDPITVTRMKDLDVIETKIRNGEKVKF